MDRHKEKQRVYLQEFTNESGEDVTKKARKKERAKN